MIIKTEQDMHAYELAPMVATSPDFEQAQFLNEFITSLKSEALRPKSTFFVSLEHHLSAHLSAVGGQLDVGTKLALAEMIGATL